MSDVTLRLTSGESHGTMLTARLEVGDPFDLVRDMWFTRIELDQGGTELARTDHLAPTSAPQFGVYLCDMDRADTHVVKAVVTVVLADNSVQSTTAVVLTPTTPMPVANVLSDVHVTLEYGRLFVSVAPGSAASWKCWARRDAEPTVNGVSSGSVDSAYLRFDAARDELAFEMPLSGTPGTTVWHVIAAGYSASNVEGPRFSFALPFTYSDSPDPVMKTAVLPLYGSQQRQIEAVASLTEFTTWLAKYQQRGYIGEVGWTKVGGLNWNTVATSWYALANQAGLWVTAWATGELWNGYALQPYEKVNGAWQANVQAQVLEDPANLHPTGCLRGVNVAGAKAARRTPLRSSRRARQRHCATWCSGNRASPTSSLSATIRPRAAAPITPTNTGSLPPTTWTAACSSSPRRRACQRADPSHIMREIHR